MQHRASLCQILLMGLLILIKSSHQKHVNEKDEKLISKIANNNKTSSSSLVLNPNQKQILSQTIEFNFPIFGQQQEQPNELENNNVPLPPPPLLPPQPSSPLLPPVHKPNFPFIYPSASSVHLNEYVTANYNNNNDETQTETNNENSKNLILY